MTFRKVGRPITATSAKARQERARRRKLVAQGRCIRCRERTNGLRQCDRHHLEFLELQMAIRIARQETGECHACGRWANFKARCWRCVRRRNACLSRQAAYRRPEYRARVRSRRKMHRTRR